MRETRSALRWVATLAAHGVPPTIVFEAITREVVRLSGADLARMERYDDNGTVTAVAGWSRRVTSGGQPTPGGTLKLLGSGDVDHLDTASAYYTTSYTLVRAPPDAEILRSQPGLGSILATRALTEFGDDPARFAGARSRRNYAANSPITRGSGTRRVVLTRVACNKRLRDALYLQAFATLNASPGARAYYDAHRAAVTPTTKPCAPWPTASSASCTAAYATAPPTTRPPPGKPPLNQASPLPLDSYARGMSNS